jgi:hypothetical protein
MLLVITATASAPVAAAALDQDSRGGEARFDRELARIARASLFPPLATQATNDPPAREPAVAQAAHAEHSSRPTTGKSAKSAKSAR